MTSHMDNGVYKIDERKDVIFRLFAKTIESDRIDPTAAIKIKEYDTYFEHYNEQMGSLGRSGVEKPSKSVIRAVVEMSSNLDKSKSSIRSSLLKSTKHQIGQDGHATDDQITQCNKVIACAVRVWLMINCRLPNEPQSSSAQNWNDDESLLRFGDRTLRISRTKDGPVDLEKSDEDDMRKEVLDATGKLTHRLTGMNLDRYCNIKTVPIDYLDQHLHFNETYFNAFKHRRWLLDTIAMWESHKRPPAAPSDISTTALENTRSRPFPVPWRVLKAALCSNDYLFPPEDLRVEGFLKDKGVKNWICQEDTTEIRSRQFNLKNILHYQYHDGMIDLAHEFTSPPKGIKTIWRDKRNPMQFFTFWFGLGITVLTFTFGVVQLTLTAIRFARDY